MIFENKLKEFKTQLKVYGLSNFVLGYWFLALVLLLLAYLSKSKNQVFTKVVDTIPAFVGTDLFGIILFGLTFVCFIFMANQSKKNLIKLFEEKEK